MFTFVTHNPSHFFINLKFKNPDVEMSFKKKMEVRLGGAWKAHNDQKEKLECEIASLRGFLDASRNVVSKQQGN